ncbi:MAG: hypothetical protein CMG66_04160 [Candidatus Marinimicrobia bacterium]|nr:hypothetical protein [Candidatus Neomarinimicrobiota bacterium]|tara:strand:+ start:5851 stop:6981 length:1131 start_codon:yes stop_codon:yes gene_type:complete
MKIALITPFPPYRGGISAHSKNLYKFLSLDNKVVVYNFYKQYPDFLFPGKTQYIDDLVSNEDSNILHILSSINPLSWIKVSNSIIKGNFDKVIFRFWNPFFIPCYVSIIKMIKKNNPDVQIYSICDNIIAHEKFFAQKFLIKFFLNQLDGIIVMSSGVEDELLKLNQNYRYKKIFLPIINDLGDLLDINLSKKEIGLNQSDKIFMFFGLIREYKGLDILLNAINKIDISLLHNIKFLIVGENYEQINKYKKILDDSKKSYVLWVIKYIPNNMLNFYFCASDYIVLPYKRASQSGIIPMAYYFNKPVIVSKISGLNEMVVEGETGFVFNNLNFEELKDILEKCIKNEVIININEIKKIKNKLTTEHFVKDLIKFIDE